MGRFALNMLDSPSVFLLYHRVTDLKNDPRSLAVSPDNFYRQIEHLKAKYNLLDVEEFEHMLIHRKKFSKNSVLLTFDDGYADNYNEALPILESLNAQAVFFISTVNIDTKREFWWDEIERIFLSRSDLPECFEMEVGHKLYKFDTAYAGGQQEAHDKIRNVLTYTKANVQQRVVETLINWAGIPGEGRETHMSLTSEKIKKMDASKCAVVGAHAHSHTRLSLYDYDEQYDDIKTSKDIIESITGRKVRYFSYPLGGKGDYNSDTIDICREVGFDIAFSNIHSQVHRWTDRYQVPRMLVRDWDIDQFRSQMEKFFRF
jgi:peptidoglycan/xylan/chitin deacetylase (PgdA/CDA1 family)